ncbi:MAG: hypothetical protein NTY19_08730, partial [Planctomycetota bacterium]|nr:hypothetical protein [Planctomycetota bacterium]
MAHVVKCPNCEQPYSVIAEHLGQRARCKNCGETFTLKMSLDETRQGANRPIEGPAPLLTLQPVRPQGDTPEPEVEPADRPVMAASQPIRIGPYLVRRKLGGGAMGEVWLAHDPDLERDVAIKTLRPEHAQDVEYLKRFLGEARNAARLQHPNTVTIFQVG